jgi:uncharacterized membrane protein
MGRVRIIRSGDRDEENQPERGGSDTAVWELFAAPTTQAVLGVLVLCIVSGAGFYLVSSFRDSAANDRSEPLDRQAFLREIRREGDISELEYRTIQSAVDGRSARESKADDKAG